MNRFLLGLAAVIALGLGLSWAATQLPIPTGMCSAGQELYAVSDGQASCRSSTTVGASGTSITQIRVYSQILTPSQVTQQRCAEQTFTVTGLTTDDKVFVNPPALSGIPLSAARVTGADNLGLMFCNPLPQHTTPNWGTHVITTIRS